jgi:RND family efflux transporter MFP subunit
LNTANARLTSATAALDIARETLEQSELRATTDGVVTQTGANRGQVVGAGEPIVVIATRDVRDAAFDVPEQLAGPGLAHARVTVTLLSNPDVSFVSTIREISPMADANTRTYRVLVDLSEAPDQMLLGATVTGVLDLGGADVFRLPASAITSTAGVPAVYVVDPVSLELIRKPIEVAQQSGAQIVLERGIEEGDMVVIAGVSKLRPGQHVRLEEGAL